MSEAAGHQALRPSTQAPDPSPAAFDVLMGHPLDHRQSQVVNRRSDSQGLRCLCLMESVDWRRRPGIEKGLTGCMLEGRQWAVAGREGL